MIGVFSQHFVLHTFRRFSFFSLSRNAILCLKVGFVDYIFLEASYQQQKLTLSWSIMFEVSTRAKTKEKLWEMRFIPGKYIYCRYVRSLKWLISPKIQKDMKSIFVPQISYEKYNRLCYQHKLKNAMTQFNTLPRAFVSMLSYSHNELFHSSSWKKCCFPLSAQSIIDLFESR